MRIHTGTRFSSPYDTSDFNDAGICGLGRLGDDVQLDFFGSGDAGVAASSGFSAQDWASILNAGTAAGLNIFRATQSPSLIPGTSLVQNPGLVPLTSAYSTNVQAAGSVLTGIAPIAILAVGAVVILMLMKK